MTSAAPVASIPAAYAPAADAPPICFELAGSEALRSIEQSVADFVDPTMADEGAGGLQAAAANLELLATLDSPYPDSFTEASEAIGRLVTEGASSEAFADAGDSLERLGAEFQTICQFRLS